MGAPLLKSGKMGFPWRTVVEPIFVHGGSDFMAENFPILTFFVGVSTGNPKRLESAD